MPFFAVQNLTLLTLAPCSPWAFTPTETITPQIRFDKEERQRWYRCQTTRHLFYTAIEPWNPNQRLSKDNPAIRLYGAVGDFDAKIPDARVLEVIEAMKIKPTWWERSLGGGVRLVWVFERPVPVDNNEFCTAYLEALVKLLGMNMLPAFDEAAFVDPSRLYCIGDTWKSTGAGAVGYADLQALLVRVAEKFHFKVNTETQVPFDVVLPRIKDLYPNFSWPCEFKPETQGPSFWIAESTSSASAIVKQDGMFTFSAHAAKTFYPWSDILGADWVKDFKTKSLFKATDNIYHQSERGVYHMIRPWSKGRFVVVQKDELVEYLRDCGLSNKAGPGGSQSELEKARSYIKNHQGCDGAAPFLYNPKSLVEFNGGTYVNLQHKLRVMQPSKELGVWGKDGNFPYLSAIFDHLLNPRNQLDALQAWARYAYRHAFDLNPMPGQALFLAGTAGCGKTLIAQIVFGTIFGGFADASSWLTGQSIFGSELYYSGIWCADDTIVGGSQADLDKFHAMLKRLVANQNHLFHKKHNVPFLIEWLGRCIVTLNLDFHAIQHLPQLDNSTADKISIFRCATTEEEVFDGFLPREEGYAKLMQELPHYCSWLINTETPAEYIGKNRYGTKPHHEPSLMQQSRFVTRAAACQEAVLTILDQYWEEHPEATEWSGMTIDLMKLGARNPENDVAMRSARAEFWGRDIETLRKIGQLKCSVNYTSGSRKVWTFPRPAEKPVSRTLAPPPQDPGDFSK